MSEYPDRWNDEWNDLPEDIRRFATRFGPTNAPILLLGPPDPVTYCTTFLCACGIDS